jgi:hypothetical protein
MSGTPRLFREDPSAKSDTVVIVGNGAVENGSYPLDLVFEKLTNEPVDENDFNGFIRTHKDKCVFLALLSFKFRVSRFAMFRKIEAAGCVSKWDWQFPPPINSFLSIRNSVATEFNGAGTTKAISLRGDISKNGVFDQDARFITTNCDTLLWDDERIKNIAQIHGLATHPESLIMPSELITDDLPYDQMKFTGKDEDLKSSKIDQSLLKVLRETYRWNYLKELGHLHDLGLQWLRDAERVVFWGTSFSVYDAELLAQVSSSTDPKKIKELVVINPDKESMKRVICITNVNRDRVKHKKTL